MRKTRSSTKWVFAVYLLSILNPTRASAEGTRGVVISGSAEGGFAYSSISTSKQSQFLLDRAGLLLRADISDRARVVIDNEFSIGTSATAAGTLAAENNSSNYFSNAVVSSGTANRFVYSNAAAYLEYRWGRSIGSSVGHLHVPFGMESMSSRYDMMGYYYSSGFRAASNHKWFNDVGVKLDIREILGHLELTLIDGRNNPTANAAVAAGTTSASTSPGGSARWTYSFNSGDLSITPSASVYMARVKGSPKDLGMSGGLGLKRGSFFANAEWISISHVTVQEGSTKTKRSSLYFEPGMNFNNFDLSVKADFHNQQSEPATGVNDLNLSASLSHVYEGGYRVRLTYEASNLMNNAAGKGHDVRFLFGLKW